MASRGKRIPTIIVGSGIYGVRVRMVETERDLSPAEAVEFALRLIRAAEHSGNVKVVNRRPNG